MNQQVGSSAIPMVSSVGGSAALPTTRKLCFRACLTFQQLGVWASHRPVTLLKSAAGDSRDSP